MFTIFDKNTQPKVVIAPDAPKQAAYAAKELRHYLGMMSGAPVEVETGCVQKAITLLPGAASLGDDCFEIAVDADGARLYGGMRGIIYAAFELLEKLGCRFFAADCEQIPVLDKIELPDMQKTYVPSFEYREHNYVDVVKYPSYAVKCRLNGKANAIPEAMGGHIDYAWFVHTVDQMVPQAQYAQEHPEYYALWGGERQTQPRTGQLCLTNPGTIQAAIQHVRQALLDHPDARIISLSQNDWNGHNCQCPACKAADAEEGSPAGTLLRFVNAVAQALEPEFPDVLFSTLAYNYTRPAPCVTQPRPNVSVQLCSIECCFSHPFETCDDQTRKVTRPDGSKSSFMDDLTSWGKVSRRNYIWDYVTCFAHYPTPHPNWRCLQPNMRTFIKNGVRGVFEQANGSKGGGCDLNELRAYVISKLLWNAEADVDKLIREFTDFYYGAAGIYVRRYIELLCDKAERDDIHVGYNDSPKSELFSDAMLDALASELEKGKQAVSGDSIRMMRVDKAMLSVRYVRLRRDICIKQRVDIRAINDFLSDWRAHRLCRIEEFYSLESTLRGMLDGKWRSVDYFVHWTDEGPEVL